MFIKSLFKVLEGEGNLNVFVVFVSNKLSPKVVCEARSLELITLIALQLLSQVLFAEEELLIKSTNA